MGGGRGCSESKNNSLVARLVLLYMIYIIECVFCGIKIILIWDILFKFICLSLNFERCGMQHLSANNLIKSYNKLQLKGI